MGELILLRHGETEWSLAGRHTGRTDVPLTPHGEAAAKALAPLLSRHHIVAVFTSPAQRAVRTAALACLDHAQPTPDLWEWDYGGYEGLTTPQIRETRPGWYLWRDGVIPGDADHPGETIEQVAHRVGRAGRARALAARAHRLLPAASSGGRAAVPAGHRDHQHARHRARRAGHHVLEHAALAVAGRLKASWTRRVSSRIQFRYAAEPATMGSAMISGSS